VERGPQDDAVYDCPVCGFHGIGKPYERWPPPEGLVLTPPYVVQLGNPSYEVCERCEYEFGFDDDPGGGSPVSFEEYRVEWVASLPQLTGPVAPGDP
jgi:hypothetical protein